MTESSIEGKSASSYILPVLILLCGCVLAVVASLGHRPYFYYLADKFQVNTYDSKTIIFDSYPLLLGFVLTLWRPRFFGWTPGSTIKKWKLSVSATLILVVPAFILLSTGIIKTPFSGDPWPMYVFVPLGEEAIFRGALFMGLITVYKRMLPEKKAMWFAIIGSSLAFGFWHTYGAYKYDPAFAVLQTSYTAFGGMVTCYVRAKTGSLFQPIVCHALVNLIATQF